MNTRSNFRFNSGLLFLLFLFPLFTQAQPISGDLPPDINDDFKYHPQKSKLSGRIAFTTTIGKFERIFVLDLESGSVYPIIAGAENNRYPTWSIDGKSLVFTSDRSGNDEIYRAGWDGSRVHKITSQTGDSGDPSWGRLKNLGATIVHYVQTGDGTKIFGTSPWKENLATELTSFSGRNLTPRLSPDGRQLAYSTDRFWPGWDVCIYDLGFGVETCPLKGKQSFCRPAWHKDGKNILFSTGSGKDIDIGVIDLETNVSRLLTSLPNREYDPVWAPDYKSFAFVAEPETFNHFQMYVLLDGERKPGLLLSSPYPIRYLTWDETPTLKLEAARIRELDAKERKSSGKRGRGAHSKRPKKQKGQKAVEMPAPIEESTGLPENG